MPLNKPNLFNNCQLDKQQFLQNYWHKSPLLLKKAVALADLTILPNKQQLQKLSCDEDIQSRLVIKNNDSDYAVEYGPFSDTDWQNLQHCTWNLLVSDIDKWYPSSQKILHYFDFIRNWIFDDIMLSCGSVGGTVGPHTDHYDVFLLQVSGQRRWDFSQQKILNPPLLPAQSLKLMKNFQADNSFILEAGDVLYLPPEIAHYGIAQSDDCVTCSIGIRLPSHAELLSAFVDDLAQKQSDNNRLTEPQFTQQPQTGEITNADISQIQHILKQKLQFKPAELRKFFGQYITEYRNLFYEFNQTQDRKDLKSTQTLILSPFAKTCFFNNKDGTAELFVNGQNFITSLNFAQIICNDKRIEQNNRQLLNQQDKDILHQLYQDGSIINEF